jgi:hypothetical protein
MGNSLLPFAHRRNGYPHCFGHLLLRQPLLLAVKADLLRDTIFHITAPFATQRPFFVVCGYSIAAKSSIEQQLLVELVETIFNQ